MAATGFDERVVRLAQYRPFDHSGAGLHASLRGLILGAGAIGGGEFSSLNECREALRALWDLDFEIEEIRDVVDGLAGDGFCRKMGGGFELSQEVLADLAETAENAKKNEAQALAEWEESVCRAHASLSSEHFELLAQDLQAWIGRIVSRHGVEAALLLYPEDGRAQRLFDEIEEQGLGFLPEREGALKEVREAALRRFVREPTPAQRIYLANRLNAAFELTVLTLDPDAGQLAKQQFDGHRLYLDTNFLYAVLGFAPAHESLAAHRLLHLTKELGFQLAITDWTVDELRTSLRKSRNRLEGIHLPSRDYAELMIRASSEKGFDRAFWIAYRESNVSRHDFFERAARFHRDLEKLGIAIVDEGCKRVEQRREEITEHVALLDRLRGPQGWRETVVLEHDVKHRLLVEQLRGAGNLGFSNARYWFLTQDTRLPIYARKAVEGERPPEVPFCMSSSSWGQVMRAFTPRTSDWEQMVVDLMASPYVGRRRGLDFGAVTEVVARIDQYSEDGVELAWEVLADSAKMTEIAELQKTGTPEKEITALIDGAFIEKAAEADQRAEDAAQREAEAHSVVREAKQRADRLREDWDAERARREGLESDLERERRRHEKEANTLNERIDAIEKAAEQETKAADEKVGALRAEIKGDRHRRRRNLRIALAVVLAVAAAGGAGIVLAVGAAEPAWAKIAVVLGATAILLVAVNVGFNEKWAGRIFSYLGILLGVAGIVVPAVLPHDDSKPQKPLNAPPAGRP